MPGRVANGDYSQVGADLRYEDLRNCSPRERVELANRMACNAAGHASMRRLAHHITRKNRHVGREGPVTVARWVRKNVAYQREQRFMEVLQGPATTLWSGVGDCDDLAILWVTLTRACGLNTRFMGVGKSKETFFHAVGLDEDRTEVWELTSDERFPGGRRTKVRYSMPDGCLGVFYAPEPQNPGFRVFFPAQRSRRAERVPNNPHSSLRMEEYAVLRPSAGVRIDPRPNFIPGNASHTLGVNQFVMVEPRPSLGPIEGAWDTRDMMPYVELTAPHVAPVIDAVRGRQPNPASTDCNAVYFQCAKIAARQSSDRRRRRALKACRKTLNRCNRTQRTRRTDVRVARQEGKTERRTTRQEERTERTGIRQDARTERTTTRQDARTERTTTRTEAGATLSQGLAKIFQREQPSSSPPPTVYAPSSPLADYAPAIGAGVGGILLIAIALAATRKKPKKGKKK